MKSQRENLPIDTYFIEWVYCCQISTFDFEVSFFSAVFTEEKKGKTAK